VTGTGVQVLHHDTIDSTNAEAGRLLDAGRVDGAVCVIAREQTAGRGTHGRAWVSPRDAGIYLSIASVPTRPAVPPTTLYTLAAGVACVEALAEGAGVEARLKPINDLYAGGGKLGGILAESRLEGGRVRGLVVGVGINVRRAPREVTGDVRAVCLEEILPAERFAGLDLERLVALLVRRLDEWRRRAEEHDPFVTERWDACRLPGTERPSLP
jgi:BirA family biotin operon repressor/biotin-[acetyl-CoA-carboxylase] ligase